MAYQYEVAVLGGGPGGYVAAIASAQLGMKTVLIEKDSLGGTCLNRGCIPTKALIHSAELYRDAKEAAEYGVFAENVTFDYAKVAARKDQVVSRLVRGIEGLVKGNKVTLVRGEGIFKDAHTIEVSGKEAQTVTFDKAIIATGSYPSKIPIPGTDLPGVMNSDGFLAMTSLPKSAVMIGGGVVVLVASCIEGLENKKFERWMTTMTPEQMIVEVKEHFELGGHKAAAISMILQKADIYLVSELDPDFVRSIHLTPFATVQEAVDAALAKFDGKAKVTVMPFAGSTLPELV